MDNYNQSFVGFIQNGKINSYNGQQIGVTIDEYNKALDIAKGFQQKLIDAGILVKPKTPEEINQELQETLKQTQSMMVDMSKTIMSLNEKVTKLEEKDVEQTIDGSGCSEDAGAKRVKSVRTPL